MFRVLGTLLCLLCMPTGALAAFPPLTAPVAYEARVETDGVSYELLLRLRPGHLFILHEKVTMPGGKTQERSQTGRWRQTSDGALVQLSNRHGLMRRLNVGGSGVLYGHVNNARLRPLTLTLKTVHDKPRPYALMGELRREGPQATVRDAASGQLVTLEADPRLDQLVASKGDAPQWVELDVEEHTTGLRLLHVRSSAPLREGRTAMPLLEKAAEGGVWRLKIEGLPSLRCQISQEGDDRGVLQINGQGLHVRVPLEASSDTVQFRVDADSARTVREAGYGPLLSVLERTRTWDMEGEMLIFYHADETLCVLENTGAPNAAQIDRARAQQEAAGALPPVSQGNHGQPLWPGWGRP